MKNIKFLEDKYLKAKISYYEGEPTMTDPEFDELEKTLKEAGSKVIEQVGSKRKDFDFEQPTKMLSLAKIQTDLNEDGTTNYMEVELNDWYNKRKNIIGSQLLHVSPKFDGNAINIIYKGNTLFNVLTRGDGVSGKSVLNRFAPYIPEELILKDLKVTDNDIIEIRAEVVIEVELFDKKYKGTREEGKFANARNYVAGVIGKEDYDPQKMSELKVLPLHFLLNGKHISQDHFTQNKIYHTNHGLLISISDYLSIFKKLEEERKLFPYQLDGVVFAFAPEFRETLGENDHDPEWSIAVKFIPEETITSVVGIEWNISKRGELIPTVLLEPVFLDGSTVRRASGYNAGYILKNDIRPGRRVVLHKSGDIIPEIKKVLPW